MTKEVHFPRHYFPKNVTIIKIELHGFSDASVPAYAGVLYIRVIDTSDGHSTHHVSHW